MTCGIYCVINTHTGDRYIGQSRNIEQRVKDHGVSRYNCPHLAYEVLQECQPSELYFLEWDWVQRLKPTLNRTIPVLNPQGEKVWQNPNARLSRLKQH